MCLGSDGSVSHWLEGLRDGDSIAAQRLWDRYFAELVAVARARLRQLPRDGTPEDVALSALKSVMVAVEAGRHPDLADRTSLWPLLVTVTARKSVDELRRRAAKKRSSQVTTQVEDLRTIIGEQPSPEFVVEVADELERLISAFDDSTLRTIALRKLEGYSNDEIAEELSVSVRTVIRKVNRIRQEWDENESGGASQ